MSSISYTTLRKQAGISKSGDENKTRVMEYFANNSNVTTLVMEMGWEVDLTRTVTFNRYVEIVGEKTVLGGDRPKFKTKNSLTTGLVLNQGGKIEEITFTADGSSSSNPRTSLRCSKGTTIRSCTFNVGKYNIGIQHYGSGLLVEKVGFSDGVLGTAIKMGNSGSAYANSIIRNNQIHLSKTARAVVMDGSRQCTNFLMEHNVIDIGCQFLRVSTGGLANSTIKSNTWYGRSSSDPDGWGTEGTIQFKEGLVTNVLIAGNSFSSGQFSNSDNIATRFIQFSNNLPSSSTATVEGNAFHRCASGQVAVKVRRGTVAVRGNYIYNDSSSKRGNNGAEGSKSYNAG